MRLKTVRLEDIRPYENNPRRNAGAGEADGMTVEREWRILEAEGKDNVTQD